MNLDVSTLYAVVVVILLMANLMLAMLWVMNRRMPGLAAWAGSTLCSSVSMALFSLQSSAPDKVLTYLLPTLLNFAAVILFHIGSCLFTGHAVWRRLLLVLYGLGIPIYLYHLLWVDHLAARVQVSNVTTGVLYAVSAWVLWQPGQRELRVATRVTACAAALAVLISAVRALAWWLEPQSVWVTGAGTHNVLLPLSIIVMMFVWVFCLVLMVNQRLGWESARNLEAQHQAEAALLAAQAEVERQRTLRTRQMLARDLHDGIGGLTATMATLASLGKEGGVQEQEAMMQHLERMALESSREVRELMGTLESPALCWPEWLAGLRHHAAQTCEAAGIHLEWVVAGQEQAGEIADHVAASSLLRAVTEALHNLVRHAGARHARMEITLSAEEVCLRLHDDGRGYAGPRAGGRGMGNMRRRVEEMGGKLQIESSALDAAGWSGPEPGTRLTFTVPLPLNCG